MAPTEQQIEAGPSTWREKEGNAVNTNNQWFGSCPGDDDDPEEMLREAEAIELEEKLDPHPIPDSRHRPTTTTSIDTKSAALPYHLIHTPSQTSSSSSNGIKSRLSHKKVSSTTFGPPVLSYLDLQPLHLSSSEIFDSENASLLTRRTTYSSLPPSPGLSATDFNLTVQHGPSFPELNQALDKLNSTAPPKDVDVDDEEFGPAPSRRPTCEGNIHDDWQKTDVILDDPGPSHEHGTDAEEDKPISVSLWDLLRDEAGEDEWEGWVADGKWESIANFLAVPLAVEKVTLFGALLCLDGFLYNFTVLPIRATVASYRTMSNLFHRRSTWPIPPSHLHSVLRMLLLVIPTIVLLVATDASKMYHTVRGQDTIKLYVIFNALEIADRLCCAFGQDVLDTLFARETLAPTNPKTGKGRKRQQARPLFFFMLSFGYVLAHTLILFYMLVSLNVAINSYDYTLLSLLISNQFVEIKGSVFKKFDKENLFQIMCADVVERFQLSLMLCVIALRNMIEMAGSDIAFLPKSFMKGKSLVDSIFSPVLFVIVSEMLVDWLKHAFITKFNHIRASVYERFSDVLAKDVLVAGSLGNGRKNRNRSILLDQSPLVARRLGFASIPLACLVIRISAQAIGMLASSAHHSDDSMSLSRGSWVWFALKWMAGIGVGICAWGCLVALKVLLGLSLLSFSALRRAGMETREAEDAVNDFGRAAVGESKEEKEYNKATSRYLSRVQDDLPEESSRSTSNSPIDSTFTPGARGGGEAVSSVEGSKKPKKWKLEEVERWTMVKRIW